MKKKKMGARVYPCKIGTQPGLVVLKGASVPKVGRRITFRDAFTPHSPWQSGVVTQINPDSYFFIDLM